MIDLDPQGNATMGSGVDKHRVTATIYEVLIEALPISSATQQSAEQGFDLVAANSDLTAAEIQLLDFDDRDRRLKTALSSAVQRYDFVLVDCPPALSMLTINALAAANAVIIPMQCEYFALEGLTALVDTIDRLAATINSGLRIEGILRTMYDPRNRLTRDVSAQLIEHFGEQVYRTLIPRNIRLAEAPSYGLPALLYDGQSRGARAYLALASEILERQGRVSGHGR